MGEKKSTEKCKLKENLWLIYRCEGSKRFFFW